MHVFVVQAESADSDAVEPLCLISLAIIITVRVGLDFARFPL